MPSQCLEVSTIADERINPSSINAAESPLDIQLENCPKLRTMGGGIKGKVLGLSLCEATIYSASALIAWDTMKKAGWDTQVCFHNCSFGSVLWTLLESLYLLSINLKQFRFRYYIPEECLMRYGIGSFPWVVSIITNNNTPIIAVTVPVGFHILPNWEVCADRSQSKHLLLNSSDSISCLLSPSAQKCWLGILPWEQPA